jgi:hypothetical protein
VVDFAWLIFLGGLFVYIAFLLKKNYFLFLPFFYIFVCLYTLIGTVFFRYAIEVPFGLYEELSEGSLYGMYRFYFIACFCFALGLKVAGYRYSFGSNRGSTKNKKSVKPKVSSVLLLFLLSLTVLFIHLGVGFEAIYNRIGYEVSASGISSFRILYMMLVPFSSLLLSMGARWIRWVGVVTLMIFMFGTSSRSMILVPIFYFIGSALCGRPFLIIKGIFIGVLVIIMLAISLEYRNHIGQGIIPNFSHLIAYGFDLSFLSFGLNYVFSYSVYASAISLSNFEFDFSSFVQAISPLPSRFINAEYMIETQKFNQYAPIPAIGYLSMGGVGYIALYYIISGYVWSACGGRLSSRSKLLAIAVGVFFVAFTIFSVQYNLRGVTRYLYYIVFIFLLCVVGSLIMLLLRRVSNYKKRPLLLG